LLEERSKLARFDAEHLGQHLGRVWSGISSVIRVELDN
jgi:hypothetical protein